MFVCRGIAALLEIICQRGSQNVDLRRSRKGCQWQRVLRLLMYDPDLITYNCAPGLRPPWTPDRKVPVLMTSTSWPSLINSLSARRSSHAKELANGGQLRNCWRRWKRLSVLRCDHGSCAWRLVTEAAHSTSLTTWEPVSNQFRSRYRQLRKCALSCNTCPEARVQADLVSLL